MEPAVRLETQHYPLPASYFTQGRPNATCGWASIVVEGLSRALWCESFLSVDERRFSITGKNYLVGPVLDLVARLVAGIEQVSAKQAKILAGEHADLPYKKCQTSYCYGLAVSLKSALVDHRTALMKTSPHGPHLYASQTFQMTARLRRKYDVKTRQLRVDINPTVYKLAMRKSWALEWLPNPITLTLQYEGHL